VTCGFSGSPNFFLTAWLETSLELSGDLDTLTNDISTISRTSPPCFRPLHAEAVTPGGPGQFGMIFMSGNYKRTKNDIGRIVDDLEAKLAQYPGDEDLASAEDWL
jgi:hypothetical protein